MHKEKIANILTAQKRILNLAAIQKLLEKRFIKAIVSQAKYYNSKHKPHKYNIKKFIYLNS